MGTLAEALTAKLEFRLGFHSAVVLRDEGRLSVVQAGKGERQRG